jgi:hypothetical protein
MIITLIVPSLLLAGTPPPAPSAPAGEMYTITASTPSEMELIAINTYMLSYYIGLMLGIVMFLVGIKKLIEHSKNPNDPRNGLGGVLVVMIGASLLFGLQSTISMTASTLTGSEGHCFIYSDKVTQRGGGDSLNKHPSSCFDPKNSEITDTLRKKLEDEGKTAALENLDKKITILFTVFQAIGLIYFIKAIFLLKSAAEGQNSTTYGKILIMLIFSSLVIDMPNTMQMLLDTAKGMSSL